MKFFEKFLLPLIILTAYSLPVLAGTDSTFSTWVDWIISKVEGSGGLLVTVVLLVLTLVNLFSGRFATAGLLFFAVLLATLGPSIIEGFFTATF